MTLASLEADLLFFAVFLLIGFAVRELLPPLQKLFLPASVIGGVIALICGQQVFNLVYVPDSFSSFPSTLMNPIMTALLFGVVVNRKKIKQYATYTLSYFMMWGWEAGFGMLSGYLLSLAWVALPVGWGLMGVYCFNGGHGEAGIVGSVFSELGVPENLDIGMVMATMGIISAMTVGMIVVNIGIRKGWSQFVTEYKEQPSWFYRGVLPEEEKAPVGRQIVNGSAINALALQVAILLGALWVGHGVLRDNLVPVFPVLSNVPSMTWGVMGAAIVWPLLRVTKLDRYVDVALIKNISGFLVDVMILTATASINLQVLSAYLVPMLIYLVVNVGSLLLLLFFTTRRFFGDNQWFENCMFLFGRGTGVAANGMALVRAMDPDNKSDVATGDGVANSLYAPLTLTYSIWPMMLLAGETWGAIAGGFAIFLGALILLFAFNIKSGKKGK